MPANTLRIIILAVLILAVPASAPTFVVGPSNFMLGDYPDHSCSQPMRPYSDDEYAWRTFQMQLDTYKRCIQDYVEGCENDSQRAIESGNEAVSEFNSFVNSLN